MILTRLGPSELKVLVKSQFEGSKEPILILGPPGCGKTTAVKEAAEEIAKKEKKTFVDTAEVDYEMVKKIRENPQKYLVFTDLRLYEVDPLDFKGIPQRNGEVFFYLPGAWQYLHKICPGIIFIDEITLATGELLTQALKITNERKIGDTPLHEETLVVCAGNPPEECSIANKLPLPLISRMLVVRAKAPNVKEWIKWMNYKHGSNWDTRVAGFLHQHPEMFLDLPEEAETLEPFPTPRSWTKLAVTLHYLEKNVKDEILKTVIDGAVGPKAGQLFRTFISYNIDILSIVRNPENFEGLKLDQKFYVASSVWKEVKNYYIEKKDKSILEAFVSFLETIKQTNAELAGFSVAVAGSSEILKTLRRAKVKVAKIFSLLA